MTPIEFPKVKPVEESAFFALFNKPQRQRAAGETSRPSTGYTGETTRYGQKALDGEIQILLNTVEGGRNHQLNKSAFNIATLIAGGHVNQDEAWTQLYNASRTIGLDDHEIEATLKSGYRAGSTQPRTVAELAPVAEPVILQPRNGALPAPSQNVPAPSQNVPIVEVNEPEPDPATLIEQRFPLTNFADIWDKPDDTEWLLYPLIPARRIVSLYSAPKVGKSLLSLEGCAHLNEGTEFLGFTPDRAIRVLYMDFENDPRGDVVQRLKAMRFTPDRLTNFQHVSYPILPGLDTATGANMLLDAVGHYEPDLVVLDTLSRAIQGEENDNDTFLQFYRNFQLPLKQGGVSLLRLDHSGKDLSKGQRGGSAKSGDVDLVWQMTKKTEELFVLKLEANRLPVGETMLTIKRENNPLRHTVTGMDAIRTVKIDEINQTLDSAGLGREVTRREAKDVLNLAGIAARNDLIGEALKERKLRPVAFQPRIGE